MPAVCASASEGEMATNAAATPRSENTIRRVSISDSIFHHFDLSNSACVGRTAARPRSSLAALSGDLIPEGRDMFQVKS
jgi:hypothetical protein